MIDRKYIKLGLIIGLISLYAIPCAVGGTLNPYMVLTTDSMEPSMYIGDVIVVQSTLDINIDDVIIFSSNWANAPVVHRVVDIVEQDGETFYITQGDNNEVSDPGTRSEDNIMGKVIATIPRVGLVIMLLWNPMISISVILGLFLIVMVYPTDEEFEEE